MLNKCSLATSPHISCFHTINMTCYKCSHINEVNNCMLAIRTHSSHTHSCSFLQNCIRDIFLTVCSADYLFFQHNIKDFLASFADHTMTEKVTKGKNVWTCEENIILLVRFSCCH